MEERVETFLNEFMEVEYRGVPHIVAKEHYREVFRRLLPKYLMAPSKSDDKTP